MILQLDYSNILVCLELPVFLSMLKQSKSPTTWERFYQSSKFQSIYYAAFWDCLNLIARKGLQTHCHLRYHLIYQLSSKKRHKNFYDTTNWRVSYQTIVCKILIRLKIFYIKYAKSQLINLKQVLNRKGRNLAFKDKYTIF